MARRNRDTLKDYFRRGKRPDEQAFADLIDSSLNTLDDGFNHSSQIGVGLTPMSEEGVVISTYRNPEDAQAIWEIAVDRKSGDLQIRRRIEMVSNPVLTLKYHAGESQHDSDIVFNGTVHSRGRKGSYKTGKVNADGKWHDILSQADRMDEGCWAFEIVAGCGERNKGRYALLVATAMHCFGSRPKIRKIRSTFGIWGNKICLRWVKEKDRFSCKLQIKTYFKYGEGTEIDYQIMSLWDNPEMA